MVSDKKYIDTEGFSLRLRQKGILKEEKRILITRFKNSEQEHDLTLPPNCKGFGRIHHFKKDMGTGYPFNPLPIDPALHFLGLPETNTIQVQVFQNAICSWRCWYCFVDYKLLAANPKYSEYKTVNELIDLYLQENVRPPIIDLSGGQPDLVPEWTLWFADAIKERGLEGQIYLWSDDNLSNDFLWRYLTPSEIKRLASYKNYGRVGCFKGFDEHSFSFNTGARPELYNAQFQYMRRIVDAGFDVYGYTTFTSDDKTDIRKKISLFVDKLQTEVHPNFPLRTVPLRIFKFSPTAHRMTESHERALEIQQEAIGAWMEELAMRFPIEALNKPIFAHRLST